MPSEPEDPRARQLEALRRYMAQLGTDGEQIADGEQVADGPGKASERRRPSLPWLLLTGLLVAVALVGGVLVGAAAWSDDRPARGDAGAAASSASRGSGTSSETPVATLACKTAVDRANAMLASAVKLRGALAEQNQVLNDPANRDVPVGEVLQRLAATRQVASSEETTFNRALDAYRAIVDKCDLRAP